MNGHNQLCPGNGWGYFRPEKFEEILLFYQNGARYLLRIYWGSEFRWWYKNFMNTRTMYNMQLNYHNWIDIVC